MKEQSTIEFLILIAGSALIAIVIGLYIYSSTNKINTGLINLTTTQFEIFNLNVYTTSSNTISGSYYQNGYFVYNKAIIAIKISNQSYFIPVSTTYYNSTSGYLLFNFNSSKLSTALLNNLVPGTPFTFEYIEFNSNGKNYIFVSNQEEFLKQN
jgi:hypothetical protein